MGPEESNGLKCFVVFMNGTNKIKYNTKITQRNKKGKKNLTEHLNKSFYKM